MTTIAVERPAIGRVERAPAFGFIGPNWFASVMGTGIVAVALAGLPFPVPYAEPAAAAVWALSAVLLAADTSTTR